MRRYYTGRDVSKALSIEELRHMAARRLPWFSYEFLESGGEDEVALAWNRAIFAELRLAPRTLVDTTGRTTETTLFGRKRTSPLIVAPTGHNGMLWKDGDVCLARAARAAGIPFTLSTMANVRLERLPELAGGDLWMQLYVFSDPALTEDIVRRADEAGYEALVLTTDANVFGWREWDRRCFRAPGKLSLRSLLDLARHPGWARRILHPDGPPKFVNVIDFFPPDARDTRSAVTHLPNLFLPNIDWRTVEALRRRWPRRLLVKGILTVEDAVRAADAGCDGVVLSNHGGRHVDACVSPMEIVHAVAAAIGDRCAVIVDSGFRRGGDVVKALALGADAVMVGRAPLYGLAAGGEAGVARALQLLGDEIHRVLGQIGCRSVSDLGPHVLADGPYGAGARRDDEADAGRAGARPDIAPAPKTATAGR